jgi:hypothetical protein
MLVFEQLKEHFNLCDSAWESVKQDKSTSNFCQCAANKPFEQFRRDELTGSLKGFDLLAQRSTTLNFLFKRIANFYDEDARTCA